MASTIHQLLNQGLGTCSEDEDHRQRFHDWLWKECVGEQLWDISKVSSIGSKETPCPDALHNSFCIDQGFQRSREQLSHRYAHQHKCEATAFVALLRACAKNKDLYRGAKLHYNILKRGLLRECSDSLVIMYAQCGALKKAKQLLSLYKTRNVFCWTALISGYTRQGHGQDALTCFEEMQQKGLTPDAVTFACVLKACGCTGAIDKGEQIHDEIARCGLLGHDVVLGNALVDMYAKCGALEKAQQVLEDLPSRDVVSWSALITGYVQQDQGEQALECFDHMQQEGLSPNAVTFACVLKACGSIGAVEKGEEIHDEIASLGLLKDNLVLGNALIDMYAKCGSFVKARNVLDMLPARDIISWSALIGGYAEHGQGEEALSCFEQMQREGLSPNAVTFTCILKACGSIGAAEKGKEIHNEIARQGLLSNESISTALVDMYAKCGALTKARWVLEDIPSRDVVAWNALIAGYAQQGHGEEALSCFEQMQEEGMPPNAGTFACVLKACGSIGAADKGKQVHDEISRKGLVTNNVLLGTALVDMYAKCGALAKARKVLEELPSRDVVTWGALIAGYASRGRGEEALNCLEEMQREGLSPSAATFSFVLKACGNIGAADKGEQIHDEIARQGLLADNFLLRSALLDMYAKCGAPAKACKVLEELSLLDLGSWNALISGYAQQGRGDQALNFYGFMCQKGLCPDAATYSGVLNACSQLGLVDDGHMHFVKMSKAFGVKPDLEHYTCMVNLFGRAGQLEKAVGVIKEMPSSNDSAGWAALLGASQKWEDLCVGKWAFEQAVEEGKSDAAVYVLMANIYTAAGTEEYAKR